jgi:hypothetical protein
MNITIFIAEIKVESNKNYGTTFSNIFDKNK